MTPRLPALVTACVLALPASAQQLPPADGMPLSEIIAMFEASGAAQAVLEVEWEDRGYWEIEFISQPEGHKVEVHLDPWTGEELGRRRD